MVAIADHIKAHPDSSRAIHEQCLRESVKTVSERLGHTNAAMTLNIYTHLWPDSEERTRAAVDKAYADQSADAQPQVDEAA